MNGLARAWANPPAPSPAPPPAPPVAHDAFGSIWDDLGSLAGAATANRGGPAPSRLTQTKTGSRPFSAPGPPPPFVPQSTSTDSFHPPPPCNSTPSFLASPPPPSYSSPAPLGPQRTGFVPSSAFGQQLVQEQRPAFPSAAGSGFSQPSYTPQQPAYTPHAALLRSNPFLSTPFAASPAPPQAAAQTNPFFGLQGTNFGDGAGYQQQTNPFGAQYAGPSQGFWTG